MFSAVEKKIFIFIKKLPRVYFIWFWIGIFIYSLKYIVNYLLPLQQKNYIDNALNIKSLNAEGLYLLGFLIFLSSLLLLFQYILFRKLRIKLVRYLYEFCINKIIRLSRGTIASKGTGYYNSIIINLTQSLSTLISPTIFDFFFSAIQMIFINVIIFYWNKAIFFVLSIAYIIAFFNTLVFHKARKKIIFLYQDSQVKISSETQDLISNSFTIRINNSLSFFAKPLLNKVDINRKHLNSLLKSLEINRFIFYVVKTISMLATILIVLNSIFKGNMTFGQLYALLVYFEHLFTPFHNYVTFLGEMINYGTWLDNFDKAFKEIDPEKIDYNWSPLIMQSIELKNIKIPYYLKSDPLNINIDNKIGLVGLSGEGKTSILKILYREIIPKQGDILINKHTSFKDLPMLYYFNQFNIMSQNSDIFNNNLTNNLLLGKSLINKKDESNKKDEISNIIEATFKKHIRYLIELPDILQAITYKYAICQADQKISRSNWVNLQVYYYNRKKQFINDVFCSNYVIKENYENVINNLGMDKIMNRNFGENGNNISGGEKQRLSIGRFLLNNNYSFFILDEPFNSLDVHREQTIIELIKEKVSDKKGLVISHKLHIIESLCDQIIVIDNGNIIQQGSCKELINNKGFYSDLRKKYYSNIGTEL